MGAEVAAPPDRMRGLTGRCTLRAAPGPSEWPEARTVRAMLLALDIGNTSIHIGLFEGEQIAHTWRIGVEQEKLPDEYGVLLMNLLDTAEVKAGDVHACI